MLHAFLLLLAVFTALGDDDKYQGKFIKEFNTYHHQVAGEVYAVDEYTFLLKGFMYDGTGSDTFFWAGSSTRPGPLGFIVPDEKGTTNILESYSLKDITITLPDNKKLTDIKWLSVYDLTNQETYGDVEIPEGFEPPRPQKLNNLSSRNNKVSSGSITILNSKTLFITNFTYNGKEEETYFWAGIGAGPTSKGFKIPDEYGYLDPLREYLVEDITLRLPGDKVISDIDWFSVYSLANKENLGSVLLTKELNVPPALVETIPHSSSLPYCEQLHRDLQVHWEVFGPQITFQLAGQIGDNDYMALGFSGTPDKSEMIGSDVTIAYVLGLQGYALDYNITAKAPCTKVVGRYKGVCRDEGVGGYGDIQFHTAERKDGITVITYRRNLISADHGDQQVSPDGTSFIVWAVGGLDEKKNPTFHSIYPKGNVKLQWARNETKKNCFAFTKAKSNLIEPWEPAKLFNPTARSFRARLGPSGGERGYQGITGMTSPGLSWYIDDIIVPELYLRRGLTYEFKVEGGNNPHSTEFYHPFIITDEPHGGFSQLSEEAQRAVRVFAGVEFTRRGQASPTAAGRLCLWQHADRDRRLDDDFILFRKFRSSLKLKCETGNHTRLEVSPNSSWPDVVYYNSFTHQNMGWKIHIIDSFAVKSNTAGEKLSSTYLTTVIATILTFVMIAHR